MSDDKPGKLIVIDAIDGAGKSTAINGMRKFLEGKGITPAFDLITFQKEHRRLPEPEELGDAKLLIAAEPTESWIGRAIRDELIANHDNRSYSGLSAAHAFALDREILYKRIILPFLQQNPDGFVIQDRGLISSLTYQPLQDPSLSVDDLLTLSGNQTELHRSPDLLLLLSCDVSIAQSRLIGRTEKRDQSLFEKGGFQTQLAKRYREDEVRKPFLDRGAKIVEIDASKDEQATIKQIIEHLKVLL